MSENCKEHIYQGFGVRPRRCSRAAVRDGYCKQHHPDAKAERNRKSHELYRAEADAREKQRNIEQCERGVIDAAKEWTTDSEQGQTTTDALVMAVRRLLEAEDA
jgi:hypothetical protein